MFGEYRFSILRYARNWFRYFRTTTIILQRVLLMQTAGFAKLRLYGMKQRTLCPYCRGLIPSGQALTCLNCRTPHHARCWNEHGACSVFGCNGLRVSETFKVVLSRRWPAIASLNLALPVWMLVYSHNFLEDLLWRTPSIPLDVIRQSDRIFLAMVLLLPPIAFAWCLFGLRRQIRWLPSVGDMRIGGWSLVFSSLASCWSLLVLCLALS